MSEIGDRSLFDLFREEVRAHAEALGQGLLELEGHAADPGRIEPLMRAAHSIKGAARIVNLEAGVDLAHAMEDALEAARMGKARVAAADIDVLLEGADLLGGLAELTQAAAPTWGVTHHDAIARLAARYRALASTPPPPPPPRSGEGEPERNRRVASPPALAGSGSPSPLGGGGGGGGVAFLTIPESPILPGDDAPLFDLFREEVRAQALAMRAGLEALKAGGTVAAIAPAARSIKGAARLVALEPAARLAGAVEEALGAAGGDAAPLWRALALFVGLIDTSPETADEWVRRHETELAAVEADLGGTTTALAPTPARAPTVLPPPPAEAKSVQPVHVDSPAAEAEAVVRVTAGSLNRLMSLAGESLIQARWLQPFSTALLKLKKHQDYLAGLIDHLGEALSRSARAEQLAPSLDEMRKQTALCRQVLSERMSEFEDHAAQAEDLNSRLYREVIVSRMRPFADGAVAFPRLVRDMARRLGKQVRLVIDGQGTEVDRDVLERLEAPLTHLLRNGVDHGIETPELRRAAGKPEQGTIRLEVRHRAGMLALTVSDDGGGIDIDRLRRKVVERGLTSAEMAIGLTELELLEFLFLPGFTTTKEVTEYSGRGVGLDVVQDTIRKVGGSVRVSTRPGAGTTFSMQMPITLSVLRAVLVDIAGEPYAFPHNRIDRLVRVPRGEVRSLEHRQFITVDGHNIGLVVAAQLFDFDTAAPAAAELPVLLLSDDTGQYGLIVEALRGEQDLVVRPLDPRLGKVPNVSAAAILDDGAPVLIADVEDLIRSMDHFIQAGSLRRLDTGREKTRPRKRVLVVDDSITVREVERQLLRNHGYDVAVAVDGRDGWNQLRAGEFDLVVTDVDMPRLNGLELVKAIRDHEAYKELPVIIVSYKDREEDRLRGLEVGASYYLTKSSFHDNAFLRAVADLIGEA